MATEHFTDFELACRCGCGGLPPREFQIHLEQLRAQYGKPIRASSVYRCSDYNDLVSSTGRDGPHTKGAVDALTFGEEAYDLIANALSLGWQGVGVSQKGPREQRFIHLDRLPGPPRPWVWSY
jgi:hypothetical protein